MDLGAVEDHLRLIHQRRVRIRQQSPRLGQRIPHPCARRQFIHAGIAHAAADENEQGAGCGSWAVASA